MSIIAVKGIPLKFTLIQAVKLLAKTINGQFEGLYFENLKGVKNIKKCYIRLSEKLDPLQVVEKINGTMFPKVGKLTAIIPKHVPDFPLSVKPKNPQKFQRTHKTCKHYPEEVLEITHQEIMIEMQSKYTKLYNLSETTGHKLLENIARTVFERLKSIIDTNRDASKSSFVLSKFYRITHPHFGDFQLILSSLHAIQDAAGEPRQQINIADLTVTNVQPLVIDNVPYNEVQAASTKYAERIIKKVTEHVNNLKSEINPETDSESDIARKKVREELKKLSPFLSIIVKQVISRHLVPDKLPHHQIRIYGEPFLPNKETMRGLAQKHCGQWVKRSNRMYNLLKFSVPYNLYASLMAMDGAFVGGAKLVIRSSAIPLYKISDALKEEMKAMMNANQGTENQAMDVENNDEWLEEW